MEKTEFGMNISTLEDELERIREKESELINKISELKSKEIGQDANEFFESVKGKNIHIAKDKEHAWIFNVDGLEITDGGKYFVCGKGINVSAYEDLVYLSGCPMPDNTLTKACMVFMLKVILLI